MSFELWTVFLSAVLGLVHLSAASLAFKAEVGNAYTVGPRDEGLQPSGMAGRLQRAQSTFLESFPIFVAFVLLLDANMATDWLSLWGSGIYLVGRVVYLPLYAVGVPQLRTFSWNFATLGLVMTGASVLW